MAVYAEAEHFSSSYKSSLITTYPTEMFICSPKDIYKNVHNGTIHNW